MSFPERGLRAAMLCGAALISTGVGHAGKPGAADPIESPKLGRPAVVSEIRRLDLTVSADGTGLPPGSDTVADGMATYTIKCQGCHGVAGSGGIADRLTGGIGTLASAKPIRTAASYWPYAPTLFDYIRRAMPLDAPQTLTDNEVYGLVGYLLSVDGIVPGNGKLDARALAKVAMPNRFGFVSLETTGFDGNRGGRR